MANSDSCDPNIGYPMTVEIFIFWRRKNVSKVGHGGSWDGPSWSLAFAPKALAPNSLPARHQYGLQIAEGMVTFFESYERKFEKH